MNHDVHPPDNVVSFASIASRVGVFLIYYDPYNVDEARRQIVRADSARSVDSPDARVIVIMPNVRQHLESGSTVDFDVLRRGVDSVCVFDSESAKRVQRALSGSNVRVVTLPSPRIRELQQFDRLPVEKQLPAATAMAQAMFGMEPAQARELAKQMITNTRAKRGQPLQ